MKFWFLPYEFVAVRASFSFSFLSILDISFAYAHDLHPGITASSHSTIHFDGVFFSLQAALAISLTGLCTHCTKKTS